MKTLFFTLAMTIGIISSHAQITEANDMKEVFEYFKDADTNTLAIFDVDMVLVQPSDPAFQMANMKRFSAISKSIMKKVPPEKLMMFLSLMTINSEPVLIDESLPSMLNQIIERGIPAMALTANLTGKFSYISNMEQWRIKALRRLGIDFSISSPCQTPFVFNELGQYRGNYSTFQDGVLFVNGTVVSKGDAFLSFLEKSRFIPNKIIFIDDREENLKSLELALQKLNRRIEYQGIHFLGAQQFTSVAISEEEFEARWNKLAVDVEGLN